MDIVRKFHVWFLRCRARNRKKLPTDDVLIIAPHPDDEVIGCGGLIARLVRENRPPHIVIMTGGEKSHSGCCSTPADEIVRSRRELTRRALECLKVPEGNIHELNFPDGGISACHKHVDRLVSLIEDIKPKAVFVPHWGEGWNDHIVVAEIVKNIVSDGTAMWMYCVWMWYYNIWRGLDWSSVAVLKMTPSEHNLKLCAMDVYIKPLAPCGKPWSGVLPKVFVDANRWKKELYFRMK